MISTGWCWIFYWEQIVKATKLKTRWDTINGLRVFSRLLEDHAPPNRTPVVLVHGLGVSSLYMIPIAEHLAPDFPIYAPDLPGYGRSDHPPHVFNVNELTNALKDWLDHMNLERVSMLGNSMGCQIAARFAYWFPGRVEKLIFTGPTIDPRFRSYVRQLLSAAFGLAYEPLSLYPLLLYDYLAARPDKVFKGLGIAINDPIESILPYVNTPTLVVRGEHDLIVSQAWTETITHLLPNALLEVLCNAAHAPNYDAPQALAECVRPFLLGQPVRTR
jgi:2-hydroxy-6-oxonona-2,4-dienedioate hydrolase